jgi:predicted O-methyltransferase YrrM
MKTLEIVVNNAVRAEEVVNKYDVKLKVKMIGEVHSKLATITGTSDNLIDFIDEFYLNSKVHPYYINEILEMA